MEGRRRFLFGISFSLLLIFLSVSITFTIQIQLIMTADASTATQISNKTGTTVDFDSVNFTLAANALTTAFGEPFYELQDTKDTGSELLSISPLETKDSYSGSGQMKGIGNVTETGTYVTSYGNNSMKSVGKGVIVADDGAAVTFTGEDRGQIDDKGNILFRGVIYFNAPQSDPKFGFLHSMIGLYLYTEDKNGNDSTKVWLWK